MYSNMANFKKSLVARILDPIQTHIGANLDTLRRPFIILLLDFLIINNYEECFSAVVAAVIKLIKRYFLDPMCCLPLASSSALLVCLLPGWITYVQICYFTRATTENFMVPVAWFWCVWVEDESIGWWGIFKTYQGKTINSRDLTSAM